MISQEVADIDHRLEELQGLREELVALERRAQDTAGTKGSICGLIEHVRQRTV